MSGWGPASARSSSSKPLKPVPAGIRRLLPRHLELIYEINRRFLQSVRLRYPGNEVLLRKLSIIDEDGQKAVRMANLATVASHHVNGVAALHSELVRTKLFPEFAELWPEKFTNVTNGVTPRRWMALANPELSTLLDERVGNNWISNMENLKRLEAFQHDNAFLEQWGNTKLTVKRKLANYIHRHTNVLVDPASLFDVQVKRIHEYKRQHLNALQIVTQYLRIKNGLDACMAPRTVIFGGKAAPGYYMALLLVKLSAPWAPPAPMERRAKNCSTRMKIKGGTTQLRMVVKMLGFLGGAAANSTPLLSKR